MPKGIYPRKSNQYQANRTAAGEAKTYEGYPCINIKCGATLRYVNTNQCVACKLLGQKKYRNSHKGKLADKRQRNKPDTKRRNRKSHLLRNYNLSVSEFDQMVADQCGCCAICKRVMEINTTKGINNTQLCIDHNHETGMVRGLLCGACNFALGFFRDDTVNLSNAIAYLHKYVHE